MTAAKTEKKYFEAVGRRKTSVARVRITPAKATSFEINGDKDLKAYFPVAEYQRVAQLPFVEAGLTTGFTVTARIVGGGISSQAQALSHGIARALLVYDKELRPKVKKAGLLKRDPRAKERRKFGLKKARKAPQWSKR